jgi:hypothetical protein
VCFCSNSWARQLEKTTAVTAPQRLGARVRPEYSQRGDSAPQLISVALSSCQRCRRCWTCKSAVGTATAAEAVTATTAARAKACKDAQSVEACHPSVCSA